MHLLLLWFFWISSWTDFFLRKFGFLSENLLIFPDFFWISFRFVLDFLIKNFRFLPENFGFLLNFVSSHRSSCWISSWNFLEHLPFKILNCVVKSCRNCSIGIRIGSPACSKCNGLWAGGGEGKQFSCKLFTRLLPPLLPYLTARLHIWNQVASDSIR